MRAVMAGLSVLALAAAASWGGGQLVARGTTAAFAQLATTGQGTVEAVAATGFPLRIGADLRGMTLADPGAGLRWSVPQAQLSAPLWAPLDWSADLALPQEVTLAGHRFTLAADAADGGLGLGYSADLPVRAAQARLAAPVLSPATGGGTLLAADLLDVTAQGTGADYALDAQLQALHLPPKLLQEVAPGSGLPDTVERIAATGRLSFARPLALRESEPPPLTAIDLQDAQILWGGRAISASGQVSVDAQGRPEGTITFATKDWAAWLKLAVAAGLVKREQAPMLTSLGTYMAAQSPEGAVRVPLAFAGGLMSLGPLPLGPAPVLR